MVPLLCPRCGFSCVGYGVDVEYRDVYLLWVLVDVLVHPKGRNMTWIGWLSCGVLVYVVVWLYVDWVLSCELTDLDNVKKTWWRRLILATIVVRIRSRSNGGYLLEARAMFVYPWKRVRVGMAHRGYFGDLGAANAARQSLMCDLLEWRG